MDLFSLGYILFVVILLILYYALPHIRKDLYRYQWVILLVGSIGYYLYLGQIHILYLLMTSLSIWAGGLVLAAMDKDYKAKRKEITDREERKALKAVVQKRKRLVLIAELLLNFGILAKLKYWDVLVESKSLILPLGISFYTFQAVGYLIDQYGGKYAAEKNYLKFLLFTSWFPQMLQGPIGRYDRLSSELVLAHTFDGSRMRRALLLILFGLVKKYAIADMLEPSISLIFDTTTYGFGMENRPGSIIVFGILLYSIWQYGDFSGGIDIVRGVSLLFGVELSENFRQPYFSVSLGDFWRRWHITLGAWMRDYVFYPFALLKPMQRFGKWATKHLGRHAGRTIPAGIANIVVFLLVGIWHGAAAHYVLWGLYNGIVIALSDITDPFWKSLGTKLHMNMKSKGFHVFCVIRTFIIVNIGWYFDRIYRFSDCMMAFKNTFTDFEAGNLPFLFRNIIIEGQGGTFNVAGSYAIAAAGIIILVIVSVKKERGIDVTGQLLAASPYRTYGIIWFALLLVFASFVFTRTAGGFLYAGF